MKEQTMSSILMVAKADTLTTAKQLEALMAVCQGKGHIRRKLILAREARGILGSPEGRPISAPTLRRYVKEGKLNAIRLSPRKVRYDEQEVQALLNQGIETTLPSFEKKDNEVKL